jgi:hypothetical protein
MKKYQGFKYSIRIVSMDGMASPCGGLTRIAVATSPFGSKLLRARRRPNES